MEKSVIAIVAFLGGFALSLYVDPHKIYPFESGQKILRDIVQSDHLTHMVEDKIEDIIVHCRERAEKDSTLPPDMRKALMDKAFWNELFKNKNELTAEAHDSIVKRSVEPVVPWRDLYDLRAYYRSPASETVRIHWNQTQAVVNQDNRNRLDAIFKLGLQYYGERHPKIH